MRCRWEWSPGSEGTGWLPGTRAHAGIPPPAAALLLLLLAGCAGHPKGPSVLLVVFDTTRADHLSCYGYARSTTPTIDSLAACGTLWTRCQSASSWTLPAFVSIFTGLPPRSHGAGRRGSAFYGLDPDLPTIQRALHEGGWETAAFLNVVFLSGDFGMHRDFDSFDCVGYASSGRLRRADETAGAFTDWLASRSGGRPFYALVHFYDPHMKYNPPRAWAAMFTDPAYDGPFDSTWGTVPELMAVNSGEDAIPSDGLANLEALYDGEIAFSDAALGSMMAALRERGLDRSTVVVVLADHGEEFLEHGKMEHGNNLFQETLHVPLVMCGPGVPAGRLDSIPCTQMDIFPTIAGMCGVSSPEGLPGLDLLAAEQPPGDRRLPSSGLLWSDHDLACVVIGGTKVIWDPAADSAKAYDLSADPGERVPVAADSAGVAAILDYWASPQAGHPSAVDLGGTVRSALRDLGYIR